MSMSLKTTPFSLEKMFSFFKHLAGLIEEHLDLGLIRGPTTDRHLPSHVPA